MKTPILSVIMSAYNAGAYLRPAIDSILSQTLSDFELILIDDASTDGSCDVLTGNTDPRLFIYRNEQNLGLTRSLNKGLALARGVFIARHDADDISHPDRFQRQVEALEKNSAIGLIGTNHYVIDHQGQILDTVEYPCSNAELQELLLKQNCFCHGSVMFRRSSLQKAGGYRETFRVTQDYDLWLRIAEHDELASLPTFLYQFRFHPNSVSQNKIRLQLSLESQARELAIQRRAEGKEGSLPEDVMSAYPAEPQRLFDHALISAYYLYASGDFSNAVQSLKTAETALAQSKVNFESWDDWSFSKARHLAVLRDQPKTGKEFIQWVYHNLSLPRGRQSCHSTIARFYADRAFLAFQNSKFSEVVRNTCIAVANDVNWLKNRGLVKIFLKSIIGWA